MSNQKHQTIATVLCRPFQVGFTLVEILVAIGLLSILALGMVAMLEDDGDWRRDQVTKERWNAIHNGILGESGADALGNPILSGYVIDMGRLPLNIKELMFEDIDPTNSIPNPSPNPAPQPSWRQFVIYQNAPATDCNLTPENCFFLGGGWRGPYVYTAGSDQYRDGWENSSIDGNPATTADDIDDALNYGWRVTQTSVSGFTPNITDFFVQSLGLGNEVGVGSFPNDSFRADYPANVNFPILSDNEWLNPQTSLRFNIHLNKPVTTTVSNLYLSIFYFRDDANSSTPPDLMDHTSLPFNINDTERAAVVDIAIPTNIDLPIGRYAVVIFCNDPDAAANIANLEVFDNVAGTCDSNNNAAPFYFQLLPSTSIVNVQWNLP